MTPFPLSRPGFLPKPGSKILIVANGPSAVAHKAGEIINRFDTVIRINNYQTSGMETSVGTRADIWVNGANQGLKLRKDIPENILVMIPTEVLVRKGKEIHERIKKRLGTEHYFLTPVKDMHYMEKQAAIPRPTTGLFSILYFFHAGYDITLYGFDFFVGSKGHYFDTGFKRWLKDSGILRKAHKHEVENEKELVMGLARSGQINFLKP